MADIITAPSPGNDGAYSPYQIVPAVINASWNHGLDLSQDYSTKIAAVETEISTALTTPGTRHVSATAADLPEITEPSVTIADAAVADVYAEFGDQYAELVTLLSDKFALFRTTYFSGEGAAYSAAESWLQGALSTALTSSASASDDVSTSAISASPVSSEGLSTVLLNQLWTDDQARIMADKGRAQGAVLSQFAARRFPLPPDAAAAVIIQLEQKAQDELAESSRKVATTTIEWEKFNSQQALDVDKFNSQADLEVDKFNAQISLEAGKFNAQSSLDSQKFNIQATNDMAKFSAEVKKFSAEKLITLRGAAMDAAVKYITALASGPEMASKVVGIGYDAQSKLISAAAAFYNARTQAAETISKADQFNKATALDAAVKNQLSDTALIEDKIKALISEAQAIAQMATSLFNNVNVSTGVSAQSSNSVGYNYSNDTTAAGPTPAWA